jgi:hypothetical protein
MFSTSSFSFSRALRYAFETTFCLNSSAISFAFDHHRGGRLARTETGQLRTTGKFPDHGLVLGVNFARIERDDDALAGVGNGIELDVHR